jgi:hypothetical protein
MGTRCQKLYSESNPPCRPPQRTLNPKTGMHTSRCFIRSWTFKRTSRSIAVIIRSRHGISGGTGREKGLPNQRTCRLSTPCRDHLVMQLQCPRPRRQSSATWNHWGGLVEGQMMRRKGGRYGNGCCSSPGMIDQQIKPKPVGWRGVKKGTSARAMQRDGGTMINGGSQRE